MENYFLKKTWKEKEEQISLNIKKWLLPHQNPLIKFTINQSTVLEKIYFQKTESTEDLLNNEDDAHAYREQGNTKLKNVNIHRKGF